MAERMRAAVLHEFGGRLEIADWPRPEPARGELLVRVAACGVCHTDLHAIAGDWTPLPTLPLIPGHEVTGHVADIGEGVAGFAIGDAVGVPWLFSTCGACEFCLAGMETVCRSAEATGYTKPGGYAEYLVAPAAFVARLPSDADLIALAPILCAGVTTYRALRRTGVRAGQWVAIVGSGGLGHIAIQYARAMGLRTAAVDVGADKLALARELGADLRVDASAGDPGEALRAQIGGAHAAIVTAVSPAAFEQSIGMLRPAGTVSFVGLPGGDADHIRVAVSALVDRELSVRGSAVGTRADLAEAVAFAVDDVVRPRVRTAPLAAVNDVLADLKAGRVAGRMVLDLRAGV